MNGKLLWLSAVLVAALVVALGWRQSDKPANRLVPVAATVDVATPGEPPLAIDGKQPQSKMESRRSVDGAHSNVEAHTTSERLLSLQRARDLLREIAKKAVTADLAEIKNATLLACLSATSPATKERLFRTPAANREAVAQFTRVYCEGIGDSPELANARAAAELDQASMFDDSEIGRANALYEEIVAQGALNEPLTGEWLDALLQSRNPQAARALAHLATDQSAPFYSLLREQSLGTWDTSRSYYLSEAVAAIIACRNGPLCAPDRAYTMTACMERGNCAAGASLLDIRRDSMSPQDWRIAEAIVASLQARRRAERGGG